MAERRYYQKIYQKDKKRSVFLLFFKIIGLIIFLSVFGFLFLFIYYARDLPRPEKFLEKEFVQSSKIYDRTGEVLLFEIYGEEKREYVSLDRIPLYLRDAVIAAEDSHFYQHFGIDFKAIGRAILANLKLRKPVQGGSTIPQQLIRSSYLTREKTLERKVREVILALELDRRYSKEEILEWYLNQVPFGPNIYGAETASKSYFGKSVSEVSLSEAALLAATIQAPSYLYPFGENLNELLARKDYILDRMAILGYISQEEKIEAQTEEIKFVRGPSSILAPHFVLYVKSFLEQKYGENFLKEKGVKVYTTLDWELQKSSQEIIEKQAKINEGYRAFNAALVVLSPKTGEILSMVGSKDWFAPPYPEGCAPGKNCLFEPYPNVVLRGRQPGSAFKPFVYAAAFQKGFDDQTIVIDEITNFGIYGGGPYIPRNYDGKFRGPITVRESLAQSINVTSIKILRDLAGLGDMNLGLEDSVKTAQSLGITTLKPPYYPSIVLGGQEVKLLEMTSAYGVFANDGLKVDPSVILKIEDVKEDIIEKKKSATRRVLEEDIARLISDILADNEARTPIFGSRSPLYFEGFKVSAKTGTTDNFRDGWVVGYTPSIAVGVWVGNNDHSLMQKEPGVVVAGPIFHQVMQKALSGL